MENDGPTAAAPTVQGPAAMLDRRMVHAFALVTTLIAAQLAARSVLAHAEPTAEGLAPEAAATR